MERKQIQKQGEEINKAKRSENRKANLRNCGCNQQKQNSTRKIREGKKRKDKEIYNII
jgi:hypothetical protein